jgi:predicted RNA-binding Zn ribbon-like protein
MRASERAAASDLVTASLALVLPDEPLAVRLMNTIWADRHGVYDALDSVGNLRAWLAAVQTDEVESPTNPGDLARFRALRDALRRLAAHRTEDTRVKAASAMTDIGKAVAVVNRAAGQAPAWPRLDYADGQLLLTTAGRATPVQRALSSIARDSMDLLIGDSPVDLRACHAPGCVLYFVKDHPRREWCSDACGNRARAARYYERHRTAASSR